MLIRRRRMDKWHPVEMPLSRPTDVLGGTWRPTVILRQNCIPTSPLLKNEGAFRQYWKILGTSHPQLPTSYAYREVDREAPAPSWEQVGGGMHTALRMASICFLH